MKVLRDVLPFCGLVVLPLILQVMMLVRSGASFAVDFEQTFLPAADKLVGGESPYPAYGYPPLVVFGSAPFALLPAPSMIFVAVLARARCRCRSGSSAYVTGAAMALRSSGHLSSTGSSANVTLLLLLGFAASWRYRDTLRRVAVYGGLTIAAKIICWPLGWLAATNRLRSAVAAVAVAAGVTFGLWATLAFPASSTIRRAWSG